MRSGQGRSVVAEVEIKRISGEQPSHERGKSGSARSEKEVKVVGHKRPCKAFGAGLDEEFRKAPEEAPSVGIVAENIATVHATDDYVLQQVGRFLACGRCSRGIKVRQQINTV